jgi:hypothetical protein
MGNDRYTTQGSCVGQGRYFVVLLYMSQCSIGEDTRPNSCISCMRICGEILYCPCIALTAYVGSLLLPPNFRARICVNVTDMHFTAKHWHERS